ncbi:MAG TPA: alpha/beta hydrolase [Thermoanaerobaculia bacterium]|nr:alpha/beta hydrolase [Thermoanaerobaculia bacterium]
MIAHRLTGNPDAPPVLLLNGGLMTMGAWEPIAGRLEGDFHVLRCDFRGQILSPGEPEPSLEAHVADVIALLDGLGLERVHAAGTSFGALVALKLAALHPGRVVSVAAITATERITPAVWEGSVRAREAALEAAAGGDGGRVLDHVIPVTYSPSYQEAWAEVLKVHRKQTALLPPIWFLGIARILSSLEGLDLTPDLARIQCPALIVAGEEDRMFPLEHSQALAAGISGARLEVVPGGSHGLVIEKPAWVAEILKDFLAPLAS